MSPLGHNVTAFTLATTYLQVSGMDWGQVFLSLLKVGSMANIDNSSFASFVALGILAGARAPDRLEMPHFDKLTRTRRSLIPHRTLTHWPVLWVCLTALFWWLLQHPQGLYIYVVSNVGLGGCVAAWLHLIMDIMTPVGIPLYLPFGSRTSLNLYKTSMPGCRITGELVCIIFFAFCCRIITLTFSNVSIQ